MTEKTDFDDKNFTIYEETPYFRFGIFDVELQGLDSGALYSGLPKIIKPIKSDNYKEIKKILCENQEKRALKLASARQGSGHDCWLKSATVFATGVAEQAWIQQLARYTSSFEFVSSQSTMVLVKSCPLEELSTALQGFCVGADTPVLRKTYRNIVEYREALEITKDKEAHKVFFQKAITSLPRCTLGFRFKINYMTLKTIYNQRKHHDRREWQLFLQWASELPFFNEIISGS